MALHKRRNYYYRGDIMPCEEDSLNEFKGHLNLCREEMPQWSKDLRGADKATRKPVSRNLNAFLNCGTGGTVYLGVTDRGKIMGFRMTLSQREHFMRALEDLMSRYKPKVLAHQYSVHFTPVFNKSVTTEVVEQQLELIRREELPDVDKGRKHVLRGASYCWCDKDSAACYNVMGSEGQEFVVEVRIKPWDPSDLRNPSVGRGSRIRFQPYYSDEEGKVHFRRQASVVQYSLNSIAQISRQEVKEKYEAEIERLQLQLALLKREKAAKGKRETRSSLQRTPSSSPETKGVTS